MLRQLMRFQFPDYFVDGCDASLFLGDTPNIIESLSSVNSLRAYEVINEVMEEFENICISGADIIIMAFRNAVVLTGGPYWEVKLGRLDSFNSKARRL